jgi:single-strand DNA-binding protein
MASFQQTIIIGNVGRLDDLRYTQSGTAVISFSVAVTERFTDSAGEKREKTNWYKVTAWKGLAEVCAKYVTKGMQIMVTGTNEASAYLDKEGNAKPSLDLTARDIQFLGGNRGDSANGNDDSQYDEASGKIIDEDIPF